MATKNIRMRKKNGVAWDELYPITRASNVELNNGSNVQSELDNIFSKTVTVQKNGMMSKEDKAKIDGIEAGANFYVHPDNSSVRHVTDAEKATFKDKYTKAEIDNKLSALTTGLDWKEAVATYNDIITTYPSPQDGWTVNVKDTDITYRYTGLKWLEISANSIPLATTTNDGRMSKEDKIFINQTNTSLQTLTTNFNKHAHTYSSLTGKPLGDEGQIQFFSDNNTDRLTPGYTMVDAEIVEDDDELQRSKAKDTDFAEVFNTWQRFSHRADGVQPSVPSELNAWIYNDDSNQIICTQNTDSMVGFVSNEKVENYLHEATLSSTDTDDDWIGVVIAFAVDANGVEHALTAYRCRSGFPYWLIKYNNANGSYIVASKSRLELDDINGETTNTAETAWAKVANGTRVKIERYGDIIVANTTPFSGTEYDLAATLTVDLNSDPRLAIFKGPQRYGYAAQSQSQSTFSNITFSGGINNSIYDMSKDDVWYFTQEGWKTDPTRSIFTDIGVGRFVYSSSNNKLFYLKNRSEIIKINIEAIKSTEQILDSPKLTGIPTAPTANPGTNTGQIATTAFVTNALQNIEAVTATSATKLATARNIAGVAFDGTKDISISAENVGAVPITRTINGRPLNSNISITALDIGLNNVTNESKATMFTNAALTGTPTAPTQALGTNTRSIATTEFVQAAIGNITIPEGVDISGKANIDSPAFTGIPTAPTATAGTNTTQLATTAFVTAAVNGKTSITGNAGTATKLATARTIAGVSFDGSSNISITADNVGAVPVARTINGKALSANISITAVDVGLGNVTNESKATMFTSPTLTGTPTAPTQSATDESTKIATTAYVISRIDYDINNFAANVTDNLAGLTSPTFYGIPAAPTAASGTNTNQIATTAFVTNAVNNKTSITGNAATATKLVTARTISLTGQVRGSATFDGSANASLATTIVLENRTTDPTSPVVGSLWLRTDL